MNLSTQFLYNMNHLSLYTPNMVDFMIAMGLSIVFLFIIRLVFLYHIAFVTSLTETRLIKAKKQVLGDLILMKDIQSEMEKEIEQASLRATFQG